MRRSPDLLDIRPPEVLGAAALTARAFAGEPLAALAACVDRLTAAPARLHDHALLARLGFQPELADVLERAALNQTRVFRVARTPPGRLRVLAVMVPGDLMANTPLGFLLEGQDARLDLLYVVPGEEVPPVPDHDVAFFASGSADPAICDALQARFDAWPRPAVNAPGRVAGLDRDRLSERLAGHASICSPPARRVFRSALAREDAFDAPMLVRPLGSHAGQGLARVATASERDAYLAGSEAERFFVTPYVDYRDPDGMFRKYRVAFVEGVPFLCHMAVSAQWMVHYLNAGMAQDAAKRAEEARAMSGFEGGFARRHEAAFAVLRETVGLDYFSIDCAELADGRLLVFEADNAAIIHMMDPPDLYPYKPPQMQRVFAAFYAMLERRSRL